MDNKMKCAVLGCHNSSTASGTNGISYFKLPKDKKRAKQWLKAIRRKPAAKMVVCEVHFESHLVSMVNKRKRLASGAAPTRLLPGEDRRRAPWRVGSRLVQQRAAPEPHALGDHASPCVDIFIKEETVVSTPPQAAYAVPGPSLLEHPRIKNETPDDTSQDLETLFRLSQTYLNPELAKCIEIQVLLKNEMKEISEGNRSDELLLLHALKLHFAYPQTYKVMREMLGLPSMADVRRLFRPLTWEINERWACGLRERFAGCASGQRECTVCVARVPLLMRLAYDATRDRLVGLDEMDGTQRPRAARHAVVVFARGVHACWLQPLACCLLGAGTSSAELWMWIDIVISKLFDVGLKVRALVTDYDDNFINPGRPLTPQRPYFSVKNRQIYRLYDCTQMMIGFRDCLMQSNMTFGDKVASWDDVVKLFEHDSMNKVKLAPGLSNTHVRPERARKAQAGLALGALTQPVAGALAIAVERGVLPAAALGTAQLLNSISSLYETLHEKELPTKSMASEKNELTFLKDMLVLFSELSPVDKKVSQPERDPGVLAALSGCARAALALAERARVAGHAALPMRAFNNDPLREFFAPLRKGLINPTGKQVFDAFRRSFVLNVVKPLKRSSGEDYDSFLLQAGFVRGVAAESEEAEAAPPARLVPRAHWQPLLASAQATRALPLLARPLLDRCLLQHADCAAARAFCTAAEPPPALLRLLERLEQQFAAHAHAASAVGALRPLMARAAEQPFDPPCACFPVVYLKTLYMRFRLHDFIVHNNSTFKRSNKSNTTVDYSVNEL